MRLSVGTPRNGAYKARLRSKQLFNSSKKCTEFSSSPKDLSQPITGGEGGAQRTNAPSGSGVLPGRGFGIRLTAAAFSQLPPAALAALSSLTRCETRSITCSYFLLPTAREHG